MKTSRRFCFCRLVAAGNLFAWEFPCNNSSRCRRASTASPRVPARFPRSITHHASRITQTILGIDPSLRGTGYGVIRTGKPNPSGAGARHHRLPERLGALALPRQNSQTLREVLLEHSPEVCVVEGLFFAQNLKTAIIMGEARGAALAAVAESGVEIFEIATRKVKQAIVGYGAAQKIAVAKMVQRMLNLAELPAPDAADALALALAHAQGNARHGLNAREENLK